MPYGLVNAPSVFQDFMHEVLREFLHKSVLVYIDDILIYSRSLADHCQHEVLQRLRDYRLFLKAEKCSFHQPSMQFLGYIIDRSGIRMDEKKVDASTTGVGAVLSQQQGNPPKLHPCAFFYRKLNPSEVNYDIRNRELLAIKLALEEWRHWLEGAKHPFIVLTDHKNLEYLRDAKRLNPHQARWALFFTRFNFTISYRPGSKNVKADALSRIHSPEESTDDPEPIIPERLFVSPITWSEETLPEPSASTNTPPGCPQGMPYIPRTRRTPLIHSTHTSLGTGHPGVNETLTLLKQCFWWTNMTADVKRYVQGCREYALSKSLRHLPSGKLQPLPVLNHPWSHLGVDFITDLPVPNGCTCVLVVVDRFSKSCRLIPLPRLPMAMETTELMFNHVFRYYGLPEDIVSDRGSQFTSRVWRSFFKLLGVTISLSSGYHQTPDERADKEEDSGDRPFPIYLLPWPPGLLEPVSGLGRVRPELSLSAHHGAYAFPVRTRLPTPIVPLGRRAIGFPGSGLLVPGEREGLGISSSATP
ncbi:hypothetical protein QTP70_014831, partial [Hemibagrus guttatus]